MSKRLNVLLGDVGHHDFERLGDLITMEPVTNEVADALGLPRGWVGGIEGGGNARVRVEIALRAAVRLTRSELLAISLELIQEQSEVARGVREVDIRERDHETWKDSHNAALMAGGGGGECAGAQES